VARVIRTFRDQGGGSILQVCSLTWQPLGRNHPNAIEGRGDHRHAIDGRREARHPQTGSRRIQPLRVEGGTQVNIDLTQSPTSRDLVAGAEVDRSHDVTAPLSFDSPRGHETLQKRCQNAAERPVRRIPEALCPDLRAAGVQNRPRGGHFRSFEDSALVVFRAGCRAVDPTTLGRTPESLEEERHHLDTKSATSLPSAALWLPPAE
jgi:hypothetical protein